MPKGKRKGGRNERNGSGHTSEDDTYENVSVISNSSEVRSGGDAAEDSVEDLSQQEAFEDKLIEALDGLTQKSAQGRTNCLEGLCKALIKKYVPDFMYDRRVTVLDGIERCLRKGKAAEQSAAAHLAPLLCVQLGPGDAVDEVLNALKPLLLTVANDKSVQPEARAKCYTALGVMTFLSGNDMGPETQELLQQFENVFSGSYLKGDGSVPNISSELGSLHAAALSSWTLLFTLMLPRDVYNLMHVGSSYNPSIEKLSELLSSPHLEVRLAAGEALANVFSLGRRYEYDFGESHVPELSVTLKQLATDSHKYRAKKDRKQQRASFRDILNFIENDEMLETNIKFGMETLVLDCWARQKEYDAMCNLLGPGINTHLAENELLREIFELGACVIVTEIATMNRFKMEQKLANAANFKARTRARAKNRDKRSDF